MYKTLHKKQGSVTVQLRFARSSVTFCAKRDTIFTDKNKKPLERQNIYNMLQTIAANAGIDKRKAHPHALRHFFAKSFYDKTHDLVMLSNILGHSDISTTKNYVTGTFEELCNEMEEIGIL